MRNILKQFTKEKWAMQMNEIILKFPSTPHFSISTKKDVRNDKVLLENLQREIFNKELIIEEKIDGANLGISFNSNADIILQNRGAILIPPFTGQWKPLEKWISLKKDILFDVLGDKYILFGEWCYAKHSIHYTHLPDYFLAFDIYNKASEKFINFEQRNKLIALMGIETVPLIKKGFFSLEELPKLIKKSFYSDSLAEGIYVRASNNEETFFRAKLVRNDFTQNIIQHWSSRSITANSLSS